MTTENRAEGNWGEKDEGQKDQENHRALRYRRSTLLALFYPGVHPAAAHEFLTLCSVAGPPVSASNVYMRTAFNILALFSLALASAAAHGAEMRGAELTGASRVISGDTLEVAGRQFRLYGVDAPEPAQRCRLANGRAYDCGQIAAAALMDLTVAATVSCRPRHGDIGDMGDMGEGDDIPVATCFAGGYDLSQGMVHTGWALAIPAHGTVYVAVQEQAREAGRGVWRGDFVAPWKWRQGHRLSNASGTK